MANTTTQGQLQSRRKAAKMLVAVVIMFAVCFFPVHLLGILRYTTHVPQNDVTSALSMMTHWLCYANSAVNPLIYNFMSGKYRNEFVRTFGWCLRKNSRRQAAARIRGRASSTYTCHFTVGGSLTAPRTETMPLSAASLADVD